jgi:hypothetical protein
MMRIRYERPHEGHAARETAVVFGRVGRDLILRGIAVRVPMETAVVAPEEGGSGRPAAPPVAKKAAAKKKPTAKKGAKATLKAARGRK